MITSYNIRGREVSSTPYGDLLWGAVALVLEMYHKPVRVVLVAWILWPINA